jgi:hypothetical protein
MIQVNRLTGLTTSFRARFLLVVIGAAVVPLALIGAWLTRSVVRAGEDLLRSELDQSLDKISAHVVERWTYRRGDLELLARNEAAPRVLGAAGSGATSDDSEYLAQLFASVSKSIPAFEYRDANGGLRWASPAAVVETADTRGQSGPLSADRRSQDVASSTDPAMPVRLAIDSAPRGARAGELIAQVSLAALMPIDSAVRLPNGARLQWVQRATGLSLLPTFAPAAALQRDRFTTTNGDWLAVRRALADPEIDLILAAPLAAYVQPFERVARTGAVTLRSCCCWPSLSARCSRRASPRRSSGSRSRPMPWRAAISLIEWTGAARRRSGDSPPPSTA